MLDRSELSQIVNALQIGDCQYGLIKIPGADLSVAEADENWRFQHDPHYHLPGVRSALVFLFPYALIRSKSAAGYGKVASIGYHRDYHRVIEAKLEAVAQRLLTKYHSLKYKLFVDKHGLSDVEMARRAGLGYIAKNALLMNRHYGTSHNIGYLLTTLPLSSQPADDVLCIGDVCLDCNLCESACPNRALDQRKLDLTRCRAAVNQSKQLLTDAQQQKMADWFYGCDICQYVCPYNTIAPTLVSQIDLHAIMSMSKTQFKALAKEKSYGYLGLNRLRRNAMIILVRQCGIAVLEPYKDTIMRSALLKAQYQQMLRDKEMTDVKLT